MRENFFSSPAMEARHCKGPLGAHMNAFIRWMQRHGYSHRTVLTNIECVTKFGKYFEQKGFSSIKKLEGEEGQRLLGAYRQYCKTKRHWDKNSGIRLYIGVLEDCGVLRNPKARNSSLFCHTEQYVNFLIRQRGLSEKTIYRHIYWAEKFLCFLGCQLETSSLPIFNIVDVDKFIEKEGVRLQRSTQHSLAGVLRSFLRFLYLSCKLNIDLSCLVTSPRLYKFASLPSVLDPGEVQKILDSVDRSKKAGLQQYGILILLTTYGLRAGEVANLKLEDIDWRNETIHIAPGKTGQDLWLPLTYQVGKAIVQYLKRARPTSKYREIFLLTKAPWTPIKRQNIGYVVNKHIQLAGLSPPRRGPHLLRHSFATNLIRRGVRLKEIGDLLGHRNPESTYLYTKTAVENLRDVALEVPGEVKIWKTK